jgi:hypothetical protein
MLVKKGVSARLEEKRDMVAKIRGVTVSEVTAASAASGTW